MQCRAVFGPDWLDRVEQQAASFTKLRGLPPFGAYPTLARIREVADALEQYGENQTFENGAKVMETPSVDDTVMGRTQVPSAMTARVAADTTTPFVYRGSGYVRRAISQQSLPSSSVTIDVATHFDRLLASVQRSSTSLLDALQLFSNQPTPIPKECSRALHDLFQQCWGPQWQHVCPDLSRNDLLSASSALKALISASIYSKLLCTDLTWRRELCEQIGLTHERVRPHLPSDMLQT